MNELAYSYYKNVLIQIKRNVYRGVASPSKPILLLAVIDNIQNGSIVSNTIYFDTRLVNYYNNLYRSLVKTNLSPMCYPFFHLENDGFWHLKWRQSPVKVVTINAKIIRDNIEYAYLDNALWDLLQDPATCSSFRHTIEKFYFSK